MTAIVLMFALMCAGVSAGVVELSCSDNATCIDNFAREFAKGLRQQKTMRLFDSFTLEPLRMRQARSNKGLLTRFLEGYAFSYDWNDYTFRFSKPENRDDALDLEMFVESKSAKDVSEPNPKKSASKVEEEEEDVSKAPKILSSKNPESSESSSLCPERGPSLGLGLKPIRCQLLRRRRRQKKKVLQAVVPLLFGMKSAGAAILAFAVVTTIVLKAFVASKMALFVTAGMALKKLYETYGHGVGLQNHPYLYSQYPIDFPSASSHAYSVSGVSPQFGSPEMYSPTAMATHQQGNDLLQQQNELQAQQSQQAPTIQLVNSTRASERWDGFQRRPMFYGQSRATSKSFSGGQPYRR